MHSLQGIIAMNEQTAATRTKFAPKTAEDWDLGLTILEELVKRNGLHGEPMSTRTIAAAVGCSFQAVQNIEARAFQKLRRLTSHLRPELEDLGVVQRLDKSPKPSKMRKATVINVDVPDISNFHGLTEAEQRTPISAEAGEYTPYLKVVLAQATDTLVQ